MNRIATFTLAALTLFSLGGVAWASAVAPGARDSAPETVAAKTAAAPDTPAEPANEDKAGMSPWLIGLAVGGGALVLLAGGAMVWTMRRRKMLAALEKRALGADVTQRELETAAP